MKSILILAASLFVAPALASPETYVRGHADKAFQQYTQAVQDAQKLNQAIQSFTQAPSEAGLKTAREQWLQARQIYGQTEVYRFSDGPIDDASGPEGFINAWPIDEAYIDTVVGQQNSGIINNPTKYPAITEEVLLGLNEKDGEKNISTGWHAIEFLLWGQDFFANGPGRRSFNDYVDGKGKNADRRRQYLNVIAGLLVKHLQSVADQWNPQTGAYYKSFTATENVKASLGKIFQSAGFLAGEELSMERMYVAYDTQLQEDEHSCFSDNTNNDLLNNFAGIRGSLQDKLQGESLVDLIAKVAPDSAAKITGLVAQIDGDFKKINKPFDQAILDTQNRAVLKAIIDGLQALSEEIKSSAKVVNP